MPRPPSTSSSASRAGALVALVAFGCGGCRPPDDPGAPDLLLERLSPPPGSTLLLNDDIVATFSAELAPETVHRVAVHLEGGDGRRIEGTWTILGRTLVFSPRAVTRPDLSDGGYLPGERIELHLRGFPSPAALRSADGRWLASTRSASYQVVAPSPTGYLFDDATPSSGSPLTLRPEDPGGTRGALLRADDAIRLRCKEPIDPTSLRDEDFVYRALRADLPDVPVRLQLLRNEDEDWIGEIDTRALLEFVPQGELRPGERYELRAVRRPRLRDFRDGFIEFLPVSFRVRAASREVGDSFVLEFLDDQESIPLQIPGVDGTARWSSTGRVEVAYPAAAGDGRDGAVDLRGREGAQDVHATRIHLAAGRQCELTGAGLVVLRAQGALRVSGELTRTLRTEPAPMWRRGLDVDHPAPWDTLSDWLAAARGSGEDWTVLVAGGDLVLDGPVRIDGPLLLVAGGRIRGDRVPVAQGGQLWFLGPGGFGIRRYVDPARPLPGYAPLRVDPPEVNPLREPLKYAVLSSGLPKSGGPGLWLPARASGRSTPMGTWNVRYVPRDRLGDGSRARTDSLGTATLLPPGRAHVLIELDLLAADPDRADPWDPPFVDRVELHWSD